MTKQFEKIANTLDENVTLPQPSDELMHLARIVADGQTWQVCENITNLCNQVGVAINYARNNTLLNHDLVGKAIEQGMTHLQLVLDSLAQQAKAEEPPAPAPTPAKSGKGRTRPQRATKKV